MATKTICEAGIVALAFNADGTECCFSPNNHLAVIYATNGEEACTAWTRLHTLDRHEQPVSGISWCHVTDRILTCSHDRTAFVWVREPAKGKASATWQPQQVNTESAIKRGCLCGGWSCKGNKIYLASASGHIGIGFFDPESKWWACKFYEPHRSSVLCLAPHPSENNLIGTGGADAHVCLIATGSPKLGGDADRGGAALPKMGTSIQRISLSSWVEAIGWIPHGGALVAATHDSRVHLVASGGGLQGEWTCAASLSTAHLPFKAVLCLTDSRAVVAGFDYVPIALRIDSAAAVLEEEGVYAAKAAGSKGPTSQAQAARAQFQNAARTGQREDVAGFADTRHRNTITSLVGVSGGSHFASGSFDGRVELWLASDVTPL